MATPPLVTQVPRTKTITRCSAGRDMASADLEGTFFQMLVKEIKALSQRNSMNLLYARHYPRSKCISEQKQMKSHFTLMATCMTVKEQMIRAELILIKLNVFS